MVTGCDQRWSASLKSTDMYGDMGTTAPCATPGEGCAPDRVYNPNANNGAALVGFPTAGVQVLVKDASNSDKLIGVGTVDDNGVWVHDPGTSTDQCSFYVSIPSVPTAKFYKVQIGDKTWGVFTDSSLKATHYALNLAVPAS
jgi:hypothetical protein